jgi:hypothetical protein
MDMIKKAVGVEDASSAESELKIFEDQCALSKKQRMIGFFSCCGTGMLISTLSLFMITKPASFSLLYSLGNIVSILSVGFLVGFKKQMKAACARKRVIATVIFFSTMIGTIVAAVTLGSVPLCIFLIILQFCALVWYSASYVPFAQQLITNTLRTIFCRGAAAT